MIFKKKVVICVSILFLFSLTAAVGSINHNKFKLSKKTIKDNVNFSDSYYLLNDMMDDYDQNIVKAGKKWNKRDVTLALKFVDVNKLYKRFIVTCASGHSFNSNDYTVNFDVDRSEYEKLRKLAYGKIIRINGDLDPKIDTFDPEIFLDHVKIIA
ncbi:MAG TPA: hypothetical protein QF753_05060 [Victivallales bacterium]|nr:hypothetical protein [Victivallales bacterium]